MNFQRFKAQLKHRLQNFDAAREFAAFKRTRFAHYGYIAGVCAGVLAMLGGCVLLGLLVYYGRDLPTTDAMRNYQPAQSSRIVDRKGRPIAEWFSERRTVVPLERLPRVLVLSVLAAEDADFYQHRGLDYPGLLRALYKDLTGGKRQGASTISQQLVKTMLLTPERRLSRKLRELLLTWRIEHELSKDQILGMYLNQVNFGHAHYGVEEASRFYFDKHVEDLTLAEASLIAGLPQNPTGLSPINHPEAARKRQMFVLSQLEAKRVQYWDDLPLDEIKRARAEPVALHLRENTTQNAPEIATLAKETLLASVGADAAKLGGYTVTTSIDLELQNAARAALRAGLMRVDERHNLQAPLHAPKRPAKLERVPALAVGHNYDAIVRGPANPPNANRDIVLDIGGHLAHASIAELGRWNPKQLSAAEFAEVGAVVRVAVDVPDTASTPARARLMLGPQGAVVTIDPRTREVLALVGGDEAIYGFNRATQAVRQPGSTWKAIEYALALDTRQLTPASVLLDAPEVYDEWKPNNYETWHYAGAVRLREALAQSINLVAIRVVADLTPVAVVDFARRLGVQSPLDPSLALALGASGVKPIELVNAYATFAAGGEYTAPRFVKQIRASSGRVSPLPGETSPTEALSQAGAYLITSMLTSVIQTGSGKTALSMKRPIAGKTGTSNKVRDAWFVGYTPELVTGVWVGYDDLRPLGRGESGANTALPIWMEVMKAALKDRPAVDFPVPQGIVVVKIDPKSGKLAYDNQPDAIDEVFMDGTAPTEVAVPPDELDTGSYMMQQLGDSAALQP